jgi:hypothetical protein
VLLSTVLSKVLVKVVLSAICTLLIMRSFLLREFAVPKETIEQEQADVRLHSFRVTANDRDSKDGVDA